jgi:hypothetical protein
MMLGISTLPVVLAALALAAGGVRAEVVTIRGTEAEADRDWCQGHEAFPLRDISDGRGGGPQSFVLRKPRAYDAPKLGGDTFRDREMLRIAEKPFCIKTTMAEARQDNEAVPVFDLKFCVVAGCASETHRKQAKVWDCSKVTEWAGLRAIVPCTEIIGKTLFHARICRRRVLEVQIERLMSFVSHWTIRR